MAEREADRQGTEALSELLQANAAFYQAFASGDFKAMDALWAKDESISCLHPGWPPVTGPDKVMAAWRAILEKPPTPPIQCLKPQAALFDGFGRVLCHEAIGRIHLVATNLFVRRNGRWRMIHHQAGACERGLGDVHESSVRTVH